MPVPFAPHEMYRPSGRIADLILQQGQTQAEAERRRGDISGQMWSNVGNTIAGSIGQLAQQRMEAPRLAQEAEARTIGLQNARAEQAATQKSTEDRAVLGSAMGSRMAPDQVKAQLAELGRGDLIPVFEKTWTDLEGARVGLKAKKAELEALDADYFGAMAAGIKKAKFEPFAVDWALQEAEADGHDVKALRQQLQQNPQMLQGLVDQLIEKSPTQRKIVGEEADRALKTKQEDRAIRTAEQQAADRLEDNRRAAEQAAEAARHNRVMERRPVAGAQPSFQSKEVLNDEGKAVTANFDARTGRYTDAAGKVIANPRPVPSAMETQDSRKFKQAEPILKSVSELSEKINTQQGLLAKMSGGAAKLAAKANYDDDVAEYEAVVSGFTPLVARALGHTGVLTQQDVDSVKALFPQPGNSKSLRDRKIARIKSIIGDLEAGAAGGPPKTDDASAAPAAAPSDADTRISNAVQDLLKRPVR